MSITAALEPLFAEEQTDRELLRRVAELEILLPSAERVAYEHLVLAEEQILDAFLTVNRPDPRALRSQERLLRAANQVLNTGSEETPSQVLTGQGEELINVGNGFCSEALGFPGGLFLGLGQRLVASGLQLSDTSTQKELASQLHHVLSIDRTAFGVGDDCESEGGEGAPNEASESNTIDVSRRGEDTAFIATNVSAQVEAAADPFNTFRPAPYLLRPDGPEMTDFPLLADRDTDFGLLEAILDDLGQLEASILRLREQMAREGVFSTRYTISGSQNADVARIRRGSLWLGTIFSVMLAFVVWAYSRLWVDPNQNSLHPFYRDRLAAAFLMGEDQRSDIGIEPDLRLSDLGNYEAGSIAPYHLINCALNLQGSDDISIHDRQSDFFIFSKRFIGGRLTGYCRSETMERVFPTITLSAAMAISGAAASPNMGRATQSSLVPFMTLLNVRLGYWIPNPGLLESSMARKTDSSGRGLRKGLRRGLGRGWTPIVDRLRAARGSATQASQREPGGFTDEHVIAEEMADVRMRWKLLGAERAEDGGLFGLAFSGGGIRSATLNLGITQALHQQGIFEHVDYLSTVSGGGFLGSSISSAMRKPADGQVDPTNPKEASDHNRNTKAPRSLGEQYAWRTKPAVLWRELGGRPDERHRSVNVSDGGHIENLAAIELLRRRCRYIIIGDGEHDQNHNFNGLSILIRTARVELGITIDIDLDQLRLSDRNPDLDDEGQATGHRLCAQHWALGRVHYPEPHNVDGYLLYLKSSLTGNEPEDIKGYHARHPDFPHQSTADQNFDVGQFESYRTLGVHIASDALSHMPCLWAPQEQATGTPEDPRRPFTDLQLWFEAMDPT